MSQASASAAAASGAFAFERVAVVNRGEPAMRLINAVREWNAEGRPALRVIAVYTAADRQATFVRQADEAVLIGPEDPGAAFEGSPYLDYAELERADRKSTRLNSSHMSISYAVFCLKKKKHNKIPH